MSRVRSSGGLTPSGTVEWKHFWLGCVPEQSSSASACLLGTTQTMHDVVVPNFHKRKARGEVFFNPLWRERITAASTGGNGISIRNKTASLCAGVNRHHVYEKNGDHFARHCLGSNSGPTFHGLLSQDTLESLLVEASTCVANKRGRSNSNLWETAAEMQKSARLLSNLGQRALKVVTTTKGKANEWLAYRYGLRPLIAETEAVLNGLRRATGRIRQTKRCFAEDQTSTITNFFVNEDQVTNTWTRHTNDKFTVRAMILEEYEASVSSNIGFTTKGLLTLPWELIPYSFVADWFLNVGDFIGALAPAPGYDTLGSCIVWNRVVTTTYTTIGTVEQSGTHSVVRPWSGTVVTTHDQLSREGLRSPSIVVKSDFRLTEFTRAADAFSLVAQRLLRK